MRRYAIILACAVAGFFGTSALGASGDLESGLEREASWQVPKLESVRQQLADWLSTQEVSEELQKAIDARWEADGDFDAFELLVNSFADVDERAKAVVDFCSKPRSSFELPEFDILNDATVSLTVRHNLRLLYGRWLATQHMFDEALSMIDDLKTEDVADPASLLFYKSVVHHRLLDKKSFMPTIEKLLENRDDIPQRYVTLATLMEADLKPLKPDSLDEISRLMDNIQVRLGHGRAGKRVRKEEDDVIAKLDKMIEQMEQQQQQQQQQQGGQGSQQQQGGSKPSQPMQDSVPGGIKGPGNIDPTKNDNDRKWGDLPPKEREAALQKLGKEYPSYYRDVIEDYFRKLAQDGVQK